MRHKAEISHDPLDARQLELSVRRMADALGYGQERSPFLGSGIEYVQSRPYQEGDPVKFMDWRVSGRTGRFHVKEYEAPRQMPLYLLVDTSASMCVSSLPVSKYAWAVRIAGGIALAAIDQMNPVGLLAVGDRDLHQTPTLGRGAVLQWMHKLRRHHFDEKTSLGRRIRELVPRLEQRCLLVVLSDLHDPEASGAIRLMSQDHECVLLRLEDPAERGHIGGGIFRAAEAETGATVVSHGRDLWGAGSDSATFARAGIDVLHIPTDEPVLGKLRHFLKSRATRRSKG